MGYLTKNIPKPLIKVRGKSLIEWHLEKLSAAGFKDIVINVHYLPKIIKEFVGDGSKWGLNVTFSEENPILETAGGIKNAISILGREPFAVINADDYYGSGSFKLMSNFLINDCSESKMSMIGYTLVNTLSDHGTVNRGVC